MRGALVVVVGLGIAACAAPADPFVERVRLSRPENKYMVSGPAYAMTFAATGLMLPESFVIPIADAAPDEVFAGGNCPVDEILAGVAMYPAALASGSRPGTGAITLTQDGPAVISLNVHFDLTYMCVSDHHLAGDTTYTFFPSNRVVRHDTVTATPLVMGDTASCGCNTTSMTQSPIYTSFWALHATELIGMNNAPLVIPAPGAGALLDQPRVCANVGSNLVALAWGQGMTRARRLTNGSTASVFDFNQRGATPVDNLPHEARSEVLIGLGAELSCSDLQDRLPDRALNVNSEDIVQNADGIYYDPNPHDSAFEIHAMVGDVPPFAIIFDIGTAKHVSVSRSDGSFSIQPVPGSVSQVLIWFEDALFANGESITVTPY